MPNIYARIELYKDTPFDDRGVDVCAEWLNDGSRSEGVYKFLQTYRVPLRSYYNEASTDPRWEDGAYMSYYPFNPAQKRLLVRFAVPEGFAPNEQFETPDKTFERMERVNYISVYLIQKGKSGEYMNSKPYFYFAKLVNIIQPDYSETNVPTGDDCPFFYSAEYEITLDVWNTEVCGKSNNTTNIYVSSGILQQCHLNDALFPPVINKFDGESGAVYEINENAGAIPARTKTQPTAGINESGITIHSTKTIFEPARINAFYFDYAAEQQKQRFRVLLTMQMTYIGAEGYEPDSTNSFIATCITDEFAVDDSPININTLINIAQNLNELGYSSDTAYRYQVQVMRAAIIPSSDWEGAADKLIPHEEKPRFVYSLKSGGKTYSVLFYIVETGTIRAAINTHDTILNAIKNVKYWYASEIVKKSGALVLTVGTKNNRFTIPQKVIFPSAREWKRGSEEDIGRYNTSIFYLEISTSPAGGGFEISLILPNGTRANITQDFTFPLFATETTAQQTQRDIEHNLRGVTTATQLISGGAAAATGIASANPLAAIYGVSSIVSAIGGLQSNAAEIPPTPTARGGGGNGELNAFNPDGAIYVEIQLAENYQTIETEVKRYGFFIGGKAFNGELRLFDNLGNENIPYNYVEITDAEFGGSQELTEIAQDYLREKLATGMRVWYYTGDYKDRAAALK